jgi:RNA polymerase sigma factor (sigma-70 family)
VISPLLFFIKKTRTGWKEMQNNGSNKDGERNLLSDFLRGDPKAVRTFFEKYGGIIRYAVNKVDIKTPVIDREDIFQDVIVYLLKNKEEIIGKFQYKCKFSTYLYIVCRRHVMRMAGKYNHPLVEGEGSLPKEFPALLIEETGVSSDDQEEALLQAIKQLDEDSQLFIRLMFYDNRSVVDIMKIFGWSSPNSVYSKKYKIIKRLQQILTEIFAS